MANALTTGEQFFADQLLANFCRNKFHGLKIPYLTSLYMLYVSCTGGTECVAGYKKHSLKHGFSPDKEDFLVDT